ncbi:transcription antitermination factor NusB [Leucobacter aridicollis]|uniref:Transcription antitermination protein NusB n=1 Tax=Leucobacter aridicollis TaxID=283878 RepID=A0A852RD94_9MICO|nr:transcription antitermination factor NusB [Leucobacter aridicollis]MBL3682100.1 transcription antitermination factor NusB [Leucobacter aridicollis]MCS3428275.1 N utilization substance protein B [Leucobacter aridicollis]NYD26850.1 N utilization substance protein B [Leucobacter aridicollis]RKQ94441.1 NusB antitermination factor [Mycolicibacterium mucogenicum 261Sha1.1M5]
MSARTKARKRALDMLFQADVMHTSVMDVVAAEAKRAVGEPDRVASWLYAREIVDGVNDHREEIDELIASYAQGWTIERMPNVDRAILRIASWEMLHNPEVPAAVAINEAVALAKEYSTDDSSRFVNGVLGKIAEHAGA